MLGKNAEAQEGKTIRHGLRSCMRMKRQAHLPHSGFNLLQPIPKCLLIRREKQEIIHISEISFTFQAAFDKMIERTEKHISPELAGEISDRQAARAQSRKQIIPRKPFHFIFFRQHADPALEDLVTQPQYARIGYLAFQHSTQTGMVNGWKELADVALQEIGILARKGLSAVQGAVRAFAHTIGITVKDETAAG